MDRTRQWNGPERALGPCSEITSRSSRRPPASPDHHHPLPSISPGSASDPIDAFLTTAARSARLPSLSYHRPSPYPTPRDDLPSTARPGLFDVFEGLPLAPPAVASRRFIPPRVLVRSQARLSTRDITLAASADCPLYIAPRPTISRTRHRGPAILQLWRTRSPAARRRGEGSTWLAGGPV